MFPIFKLFVDFVPRIEKNTSFDNFSDELLYPTAKSPVYSTPSRSKIVLIKYSDFINKNLVAQKPNVLFSEKIVLFDTTKVTELISLLIPFHEKSTVLFNGRIPLFTNSFLDLDYFKKIYSSDSLVLSNLDTLKKQYISLCNQFDIDVTDTGFGEFILEGYSSLSYIASDPETPYPPDIPDVPIEDLI